MISTHGSARVTSQREAARRLGLSHTALQKAAQAGRIRPEPGGGWNVEKLRAQLAASGDPARQACPLPATTEPSLSMPENGEPAAVEAFGTAGPTGARPSGATFHEARTANEVLKAQRRRLDIDEQRGRLVDKGRALLLVHRLAREERDAILAWPARMAAELAAELGVDAHRLQTLLDQRLRIHLAERNGGRVAVD